MSDAPEAADPEAVRHVASLARVDLDDEEIDRFAEQFADILAYFDRLDDVPEMEQEPELTNVMRADEEQERLSTDEALANAPETVEDYFKGPRVS